ncbi:LOW QUALITY PROTEIN: Hypothetical protein PHPALM_11192 [Phytophthora palmivora]|uniref:Uncharacterized protein n=1 Tax=Phytophthora palmivora TaxID=4796 RepID=A0A2P4Y2U0_9STRA|nr:LOW QUALITY PROTEIN: Hypothetical protein PHPALM_11192 [Phytophthora palmivora]
MEWSDTAEVAETTILLLIAMDFRVTSRPSPWILSDWNLDLASVELLRWRGKLKKAFEVQIKPRLLTVSDGGSQLGGAGYQLGENSSKTPYLKDPKGGQPATNPSKVTTMKTPETKKAVSGDSRDALLRSLAHAESEEESNSASGNPKKTTRLKRKKIPTMTMVTAQAEMKRSKYHLSNDRGDQGGSQYLELRSHVSLDKIAQFDGRRYRSDDSLQWLKRFIYEMKGTYAPRLLVRTLLAQPWPYGKVGIANSRGRHKNGGAC